MLKSLYQSDQPATGDTVLSLVVSPVDRLDDRFSRELMSKFVDMYLARHYNDLVKLVDTKAFSQQLTLELAKAFAKKQGVAAEDTQDA